LHRLHPKPLACIGIYTPDLQPRPAFSTHTPSSCQFPWFVVLQRGKLISENPEEEAKQKNIKSLLNKITPEKYAVIRDKLLAANVDSALSLYGLIDQVSSPF
jgi:hypothetical protein